MVGLRRRRRRSKRGVRMAPMRARPKKEGNKDEIRRGRGGGGER